MPDEKTEEQAIKGFSIVRIHYSADPEKDEAWAKRKKQEVPTETWNREYELTPGGSQKEYAVYSDWKKDTHEDKDLRVLSGHPMVYRGWDFGKVHPAVVWIQVLFPWVNILYELVGDNITLEEFALIVIGKTSTWFPDANKIIDVCDPHGINEKDDGRSSIRVLKDLNIQPRYRFDEREIGISEVERLIKMLAKGRPVLRANPITCPSICEGFRSGYKRNRRGEIIRDGWFEHPMDALRYVITMVFKHFDKSRADADKKAKNYVYRPRNQFTGY